jgi:pyruvate,water dikinase
LSLIARKDFGKRIAKRKGAFRRFFKLAHTVPPKVLKRILFEDTSGTAEKLEGFLYEKIASATAGIESADTLHDRLRAIYGNINMFKHIIKKIAPNVFPGILSMKRLGSLEQKLLGTDKYARGIIKGLEGNVTTEMGLLVGDIADYVRRSETLRHEFENKDHDSLIERIMKLEDETEFKQLLDSFMKKYGSRAAGEIDIAIERWAENPEPFINSVLSMADGMTDSQHRTEYAETKKEALAAADEFISEVAKKHGQGKAKRVTRFIKMARDCLPAREHPKFMMMHVFYTAKKALLAEADKLVRDGRLECRQDIFMLGMWELDHAAAKGEDLKEIVAERKAEYARYRELTPPRVVTSDGEIIKASYTRKDLPEGALVGVGVSSGVVEGIARVVLDPTDVSIEKGEILVAPYTDPGWTTLFINAAGLVTEIGGLLTHGTVVAREYGIPAVVGCDHATTRIQTGNRIKIDGNNGFVIIEEE